MLARATAAHAWLLGPVFVGLFGAAAYARTLLLIGSVPAFKHDWQWPDVRSEMAGFALRRVDAWSWDGLGHPNGAVQVHPWYMALTALGEVLGPYAGLIVFYALIGAASAVGAFLLARAYNSRSAPAVAAALIYSCGPVAVTKFVAGHLQYSFAYAVLPWLLLALRRKWSAASIASIIALSFADLHVGIVASLIAMVFLTKVPCRRDALFTLLVLGTLLPQLWSLVRPDEAAFLKSQATSITWEQNLSSPLLPAFLASGYFGHYWETAIGALPYVWAVPATMLTAIALPWLERRHGSRLAALYLAGVALLSGTHGPLKDPLRVAFTAIPAFSSFRELYHLACLIALPGIIGLSLVLSRLPLQISRCTAAVLIFCAIIPWWRGGVAYALGPGASQFGDNKPAVSAVLNQAGVARVVIVPSANPTLVIKNGSAGLGAEPNIYPMGGAVPFYVYAPYDLDGAVIWDFSGDARGPQLDRSLGVQAVMKRSDSRIGLVDEEARRLSGNARFDAFPNERYHWKMQRQGAWEIASAPRPNSIIRIIRGEVPRMRRDAITINAELHRGDGLGAGWSPATDWWFMNPAVADLGSSGMVTGTRAAFSISCPKRTKYTKLTIVGHGSVGTRSVSGTAYFDVPCSTSLTAKPVTHAFVAVAPFRDSLRVMALAATESLREIALLDVQKTALFIHARAGADCLHCTVALSESYSPGWQLQAGRSLPVGPIADAEPPFLYWPVTLHRGETLTIWYGPNATAIMLEFVAVISWTTLLGLALCLQKTRV